MAELHASKLFNVEGLVVVITGAGSGLGAMMAKALDANGAAKVFIVGRRKENLEKVAKEAINGSLIPVQCDVTSKESLQDLAKTVQESVGYVNTLILNAGISGPSVAHIPKDVTLKEYQSALWEPSMEDFTQTYAVNCTAAFYTAVAFLGLLDAGNKKNNVEQKSQLIATTSIAGFNRKTTGGFAYGSSKAGATHLMKSLSTMFSPYMIRSNVIAPGLYPSEMTQKRFQDLENKEGAFPREEIPLTRGGQEEDMAGTVLYLCSRAGAYCNGMVAVTDGGRLSVMPGTY